MVKYTKGTPINNKQNINLVKSNDNIYQYSLQNMQSSELNGREFFLSSPTLSDFHHEDIKKFPLVLLFHGGGKEAYNKNGSGILNYSQFMNINCFCLSFKGQPSNNSQTWENAYPWLKSNPKNDVLFVKTVLKIILKDDGLLNKYLDVSEIFASGKSDGGGFCVLLQKEFPMTNVTRFTNSVKGDYETVDIKIKKVAICSAAHFVLKSSKNKKKIPKLTEGTSLLEIHGTGDTVMPFKGQQFRNKKAIKDAEYWKKVDSSLKNTYTYNIEFLYEQIAKQNNFTAKQEQIKSWNNSTVTSYRKDRSDDMVYLVKVPNQNHTWQGHPDSGPDSNKESNKYFDATICILDFFGITDKYPVTKLLKKQYNSYMYDYKPYSSETLTKQVDSLIKNNKLQ